MAGTVVADTLEAASTSTLVLKNGVANTPPTIQDSGGVQIGTFCRAWVNFNGTGTPAIRASFNVSSITDNGTGDYTVNFTTAMPDVNYAVETSSIATAVNAPRHAQYNTLAVGSVVVYCCDTAGGAADPTSFSVAIFR